MDWELRTIQVKDPNGQIITRQTDEQIDKVGNVYQKAGGVIPKACQNCEVEFEAKLVNQNIVKDVPVYQCSTCKQSNPSGEWAFNHTLEYKDHVLKRIIQKKIVGVNITLKGNVAQIHKLKNDIIILCEKCIEDG